MENQTSSNGAGIVLAVVVTAVLVAGGMYLWEKSPENDPDNTPEQSSVIEENSQAEPLPDKIILGYEKNSTEWDDISLKINEKTGEDLKSLYIAESADNKDLVYVSTSSQLPDEWTEDMKSTNKIYSYNTKTNDLKMLYEEKEGRLLRTLGVDGTKLVLLYDGIDNSPAPCFSVWLDGLDYGYLDIENPSELKDYTVPDYQKELAKKEQKECELSMEQ